jgi:hypothetical protein
MIRADSLHNKHEEIAEISPFLLQAIDELHQHVQQDHEVKDIKATLLKDIEHLEPVVQDKLGRYVPVSRS